MSPGNKDKSTSREYEPKVKDIEAVSAESHVYWSGGRLACSAKEFRSSLKKYQRNGEDVVKQLQRIEEGDFTGDDLKNFAALFRWLHGLNLIAPGFYGPIHSLLAHEFKFVNELTPEKQTKRIRLLARELGQLSFEVSGKGESPTLAELLPKELLFNETSHHEYIELDPDAVSDAGGDIVYMRRPPLPDPLNRIKEFQALFDPHGLVEQPPGDPPGPTVNYRIEYGGGDWEFLGLWHGNAYSRTRRVGHSTGGKFFSVPWIVEELRVLLSPSNGIGELLGGSCESFCSFLMIHGEPREVGYFTSEVSVSDTKYCGIPGLFCKGRISWHLFQNPGFRTDKFYCNGKYLGLSDLDCVPAWSALYEQ